MLILASVSVCSAEIFQLLSKKWLTEFSILKNPVNQSQPKLTLQEYQQQVQTPDLFYPLYKGCFIGTIIPRTFIKLHS